MLPGEAEELLDLEPAEAAEELLARMLDARRYRDAADHLRELLEREAGRRYRSAPLPRCAAPRRSRRPRAPSTSPRSSATALGGLLREPPQLDLATSTCRRSRSPSGSSTCARCCAAARCTFDEAVRGADRVTVAVTLFALLELYKQRRGGLEQAEPFGEIAIERARRRRARRA